MRKRNNTVLEKQFATYKNIRQTSCWGTRKRSFFGANPSVDLANCMVYWCLSNRAYVHGLYNTKRIGRNVQFRADEKIMREMRINATPNKE